MADVASYDTGQYTPWEEAGEAAATSAAAEETWDEGTTSAAADTGWAATTTSAWWDPATTTTAAPTTSMSPAWTPPSSSTAWSSSSSSTTTPAPSSSSSTTTTTTTTPSSSSVSTTTSTSASSSSSPASSSSILSISPAADKYATVSRYSNPSGTALASSSSSSSGSSFKITYLIPVFVGLPIIACFALAACTYGRWWGRDKRRMQTPFSDGIGGAGAWWGGAGGGSWGSRRSRRDADAEAEETGGLVEGKWTGGADDYDEKRSSSPVKGGADVVSGASRWSGFFGGGAGKSGQREDRPDVPFLSISHAPPMQQDAPFVPPTRSSSTHDFPRWGQVAPQAPSGQHLTAGVWGASSASQRWVKRSGSARSTLSDKIRSRFSAGSAPLVADCPSPSVYSPNVEAGNMGAAGAYMGLHSALEEEDEDLLADEKVDYDALLGAARVGDGHLARKYANGEVTDAELFPPRPEQQQPFPADDARERYYARHGPFAQPYRDSPPAFAVDLPAAPSRLQVSPKKSATVLSRPAPDTPERTPTGNLLFAYESPVRAQPPSTSRRPPLPPAPRVSPARAPTSAPLTEAPPRIPFRQQAPPHLARPASRPAAPSSPETRQDLFFSGPPAAPSSSGHGHVGAPMPAFEASELAYEMDGADALALGAAAPASKRTTGGGRSSPTKQPSSRGLRELAAAEAGPRSRRDDAERLKRAATEVKPSVASQQTSKAHKASSRSGSTPTKARPLSAYAQLPSQQQPEAARVSHAPSRADLRPSKSSAAQQSRPRPSLGFDPVFDDAPALAPLQHPSKVRAAIENIETRAPTPEKAHHRKTASHDSSRSGRSASSTAAAAKLPAPQRLERSTTAAAPTTYRRALGRKGLDTDSDSSDDDEAIATKRRVSMLILNRSKSQSGALSNDSHESTSIEDEARQARPLSSDPRRLSMMLRRGSSAANLAAMVDDE
ncbi:hypothetical protein JCM10450v2_000851 [Rhodotorula kratochvilovae]